jgi:hypothetical protein
VNLFTLFNPHLQVQMLVELIYQLMLPLGASEQHAKLVTAKKNVIMAQSTYMNQLASIFSLMVQVCVIFPGPLTGGVVYRTFLDILTCPM